ncbi:MAG: serpin family protein [bacterium]|nr:serpin family protein [bacterium]
MLAPVADRLSVDPDAPVRDWVGGVNTAGWGFHRRLRGNAVSSPLSIGIAFSLSRAGASADTGAVLDRIFGFPPVGLHSAANTLALLVGEASAESTILEVATRLFPDDEFSPLPDFVDTASAHYGAAIQPVDTRDAAAAAETINRWVSETTRGLIPIIVSERVVEDQELILANTVYLKADWVYPFLPDDSGSRFTTDDGRSVRVPFMSDHEPVYRRFVRLEDADAVELAYQGGQLAMWLIVPHDPTGLAELEDSLDGGALSGLPDATREGLVDVTMPKWEQTLPPTDLFEWLCPLGFCEGAPFDGIAPGIFITAALHGAKVTVDERGTEAAGATALAFQESAPPQADLTIVADRPFLWAIIHQHTGSLLFVGRLVDPTA